MYKNKLKTDTYEFLNSLESENTKLTYDRAINDFLKYLFGKELKDVTKELFNENKIDYQTMVQYKIFLTEEKKAGSQTIRTKIYSITSWITYLYKIGYDVPNPQLIKLDKKIMPKINDNNGSKPFTHGEVKLMISKSLEYPNGLSKSLLIELAYITSWRKEALLNVKVKDIYKYKDNCNYYLIDCTDKGQKQDTKPIDLDFYSRISDYINENELQPNDFLFKMSDMTCSRLMDRLKKDLDIRGDKTFHSLRKASINRVLDLTNDLIVAKKHANHDNISTTEKFYIKNNMEYSNNVALFLMDDIDDTKFDNLSKEELLELIKNSEDKTKYALLTQLKNVEK